MEIKKRGSRAVTCAYSLKISFTVFSQWSVVVEKRRKGEFLTVGYS
jgi:hypothetical protein